MTSKNSNSKGKILSFSLGEDDLIDNAFGTACYQTRQALAGIMGWPVLHPNAWPNSGMFCTTPLTRNSRGECSSVCTCRRTCSGRLLPHQFCPCARKNCCTEVKPLPSRTLRSTPLRLASFCKAINANRNPPLSAVFSPNVSWPFTLTSSTATKPLYSFTSQSVMASYFFASSAVHQSERLPLPSNLRPWSSKP